MKETLTFEVDSVLPNVHFLKIIKFTDIPRLIEETCAAHDWIEHPNLEELLKLELWATEFVRNALEA